MSLFGSLMGDVEDDPFFGSHMRHMRQMNNMMNSLFSDPFGMLGGGGPLAIGGPRHGGPLMPFMPQMPSINRLFSVGLDGGHMGAGHMGTGHMGAGHMGVGHMGAATSFSSSTVVMSSGPNGKPQVYSSSSSTKIGPNGVKETRKTLQDSRTGTKKMSIGHHIGERAHVVEREQNVYSGDAEERQEFINLDEDEAEEFDREFQHKAGSGGRNRALPAPRRSPPLLALPAPSIELPASLAPPSLPKLTRAISSASEERRHGRPAARRPLRTNASPLATHSTSVREVYGSAHPQRRHKHAKHARNSDN